MSTENNKTENNKVVLSKKSIGAIADQVEARMQAGKASNEVSAAPKETHAGKKVFFWGAASGLAFAFAAPLLSKQARPAVRGAIKGGLLAGRYVQKVASSVKEDVQDLSAEAKADLDAEAAQPDEHTTHRKREKTN
jgi:hypothetical protein